MDSGAFTDEHLSHTVVGEFRKGKYLKFEIVKFGAQFYKCRINKIIPQGKCKWQKVRHVLVGPKIPLTEMYSIIFLFNKGIRSLIWIRTLAEGGVGIFTGLKCNPFSTIVLVQIINPVPFKKAIH